MATDPGRIGSDPVGPSGGGAGRSLGGGVRRATTETKQAFKTTEFMAYVAVLVAVLIAGHVIDRHNGNPDYFGANLVWLYVVILTFGYLLSRGLAKSGSRERYWDDSDR